MLIWGVSAKGHDASISVVSDGEILFAAHSERYSKLKNDANLNVEIVQDALRYGGHPDLVVWYENPYTKTARKFIANQKVSQNEWRIRDYLQDYGITAPVTYESHHHSHAAAGYFTSPFKEAAVLVVDAIGEFDTTTIWHGNGNKLEKKLSIKYPHSLGLWYSAMTQRVGLKPNEEEYILMGMAAYGDCTKYSHMLLYDFFDTNKFISLKHNLHRGCMWWRPELTSEQDKYDIAAATQFVYEMFFHKLLARTKELTNSTKLVLGGGCALNCVANSIAYQYFDEVWIVPNPGDAGNSLGAILAHTHEFVNWNTPYLGYNIEGEYPIEALTNELKQGNIVGVASGRAEFGPRALGNRSLLADPRGDKVKDAVNNIKRRQKFRPFAPSILEEHANEYFVLPTKRIPYMQYTVLCRYPTEYPGIVHADGTSRVQTVSETDNPNFYCLLKRWYEETGCPMLLNTSLNIKGMPMVNDTEDALKFMNHYNVKVY